VTDTVFRVRFSNHETPRILERTAAALGVSATELAEAAIERELMLVGSGPESRLARAVERLKSAGPLDIDDDIQDFARSEFEVEDPLTACRVESPDKGRARAGDIWEDLGSTIDETIASGLHRLGVPTREEIRKLTWRVEELSAKVEQLRPQVTPAAPATGKMPVANKSGGKSRPKAVE